MVLATKANGVSMGKERDKLYVQVDTTGESPPALGGGELPVGTVLLFDSADDDPNVLLGYGTWELL